MTVRRTTSGWVITGLAATLALATACGGASNGASAEGNGQNTGDCDTYPDNDITMVIGRSPGGGHDEYGRFLAPLLEKELGVTVIVENVDGAGGRVAVSQVQSADPDGYTIHLMEPNGLAAVQGVQEVDYDLTDFTMLGTVNSRPTTIAVAADSDFQTFEDLVAAGQDEELRFATAGLTSPNFVNGVIAAEAAGIKLTPVPHDGSAEAITSVVRGDTDFTAFSADSIAEAVEAGDLRALAQFGDEPYEELADVPMAEDVGLDELGGVLTTNLIFVAPPGLAECVQEPLTEAVQNALNSDEFAQFGEEGRIVTPGAPEQTSQLIEASLEAYEKYADVYGEYVAG